MKIEPGVDPRVYVANATFRRGGEMVRVRNTSRVTVICGIPPNGVGMLPVKVLTSAVKGHFERWEPDAPLPPPDPVTLAAAEVPVKKAPKHV